MLPAFLFSKKEATALGLGTVEEAYPHSRRVATL